MGLGWVAGQTTVIMTMFTSAISSFSCAVACVASMSGIAEALVCTVAVRSRAECAAVSLLIVLVDSLASGGVDTGIQSLHQARLLRRGLIALYVAMRMRGVGGIIVIACPIVVTVASLIVVLSTEHFT
jgi:hypothetical protein